MNADSNLTGQHRADVQQEDEGLRLTEVLEEYLADLERGVAPSRQELMDRHPDLSEGLAKCLDSLEVAQRIGNHMRHDSTTSTPSDTADPVNADTTIGDFRILREIGRGGMGVVYEAEQISLPRRVAMKVLPFVSVLDPRQLERFKNEARAAATLDHPGIVSIYSVGCERDVHFFVMQLIEGKSLDEVIAEWQCGGSFEQLDANKLVAVPGWLTEGNMPEDEELLTPEAEKETIEIADDGLDRHRLPASSMVRSTHPGNLTDKMSTFRFVARLGSKAAEALDHAHTRGIVHRDIKPGNLILDVKGRIHVTDFGLACIEAEAGITMTGDILGTLSYMSPEQALSKQAIIDHRTDIYSLGATLYELLTLTPPFAGSDRQDLLRKIVFEEPHPPRQINKAIPYDLGTIVLKAMRKCPEERYTTARELADDLKHFLNDEPIKAKRPIWAARLSKWTRRHRAFSWAAAAVLVVIALTSTISTVLISESHQAEKKQYERAESLQETVEQQAMVTKQLLYTTDIRMAAEAWRNQDMSKVSELLHPYRPGGERHDNCGYEWHLLNRFSHGNIEQLAAHDRAIYSVVYSPDGKWIATAGEDSVVRFHQATTGELDLSVNTRQGEVNSITFTPSGESFATAGDDGTVKYWQFNELQLVSTVKAHRNKVFDVCFTPDGQIMATCGKDPTVRLWDPVSGKSLGLLKGHEQQVEAIAISPDGLLLASVSGDGSARIWDLATRSTRYMLPHGEHRVLSLAFGPNNHWLLTAGIDKILRLWDVQSGKENRVFPGRLHHDELRSVAMSDDASWVATGDGRGAVRVWRILGDSGLSSSHSQEWSIAWCSTKVHHDRVYALAFSPQTSQLVSISQDGQLMRLHSRPRDSLFVSQPRPGGVQDIAPVTHQDMLATAGDEGVHLIRLSTGEIVHEFLGGDKPSSAVTVSPNAQLLAAGLESGEIRVWDLLSGSLRARFMKQVNSSQLSFSPRGDVLAYNSSKTLTLFDINTGLQTSPSYGKLCSLIEFSPSGSHIALTKRETNAIEIWDWRRRVHVRTLQGHGATINRITYGPHGRLLACVDKNRRLIVWDTDQGDEIFSAEAHGYRIHSLMFTPDAQTLITSGDDGCMRMWHVATGMTLFDLVEPHDDDIVRAALGFNGRFLCYVTRSERLLRIAPGVASGPRNPQ